MKDVLIGNSKMMTAKEMADYADGLRDRQVVEQIEKIYFNIEAAAANGFKETDFVLPQNDITEDALAYLKDQGYEFKRKPDDMVIIVCTCTNN